jgi:hypothetical protein
MDKQYNVRELGGLQNILQAGVDNHFGTPGEKRGHEWTRLTTMCANSGNGLIRTQIRIDEIAEKRALREERRQQKD